MEEERRTLRVDARCGGARSDGMVALLLPGQTCGGDGMEYVSDTGESTIADYGALSGTMDCRGKVRRRTCGSRRAAETAEHVRGRIVTGGAKEGGSRQVR